MQRSRTAAISQELNTTRSILGRQLPICEENFHVGMPTPQNHNLLPSYEECTSASYEDSSPPSYEDCIPPSYEEISGQNLFLERTENVTILQRYDS